MFSIRSCEIFFSVIFFCEDALSKVCQTFYSLEEMTRHKVSPVKAQWCPRAQEFPIKFSQEHKLHHYRQMARTLYRHAVNTMTNSILLGPSTNRCFTG